VGLIYEIIHTQICISTAKATLPGIIGRAAMQILKFCVPLFFCRMKRCFQIRIQKNISFLLKFLACITEQRKFFHQISYLGFRLHFMKTYIFST